MPIELYLARINGALGSATNPASVLRRINFSERFKSGVLTGFLSDG